MYGINYFSPLAKKNTEKRTVTGILCLSLQSHICDKTPFFVKQNHTLKKYVDVFLTASMHIQFTPSKKKWF